MNKLIEILTDLHSDIDFLNEENLIDNNILDSFDIINLISEIEYNFNVLISAEHILPENFNSIYKIYDLINKIKEK